MVYSIFILQKYILYFSIPFSIRCYFTTFPENVYFRISFFMVSQMISLPLQRETTTLH
ncbi:hypothetical protein M083_0158 [Bacteroides fragilis str. 3986 T(B)9]|uniref:Uncharacterized protein n=7 Tax=Bacteroides fragilis TaxID=817 RepID=A0A015U7J5_BACFG|nr:hypothetical protein M101_0108 [Bacteroides fragilis str. 1007-1-F \